MTAPFRQPDLGSIVEEVVRRLDAFEKAERRPRFDWSGLWGWLAPLAAAAALVGTLTTGVVWTVRAQRAAAERTCAALGLEYVDNVRAVTYCGGGGTLVIVADNAIMRVREVRP